MAKNTVFHLKKDCISCGACAAIAPDYWEMDQEGLAHLKGSKEFKAVKDSKDALLKDDHWELDIDTEEARVMNQEAADVCPVNIIHVKPKKEK